MFKFANCHTHYQKPTMATIVYDIPPYTCVYIYICIYTHIHVYIPYIACLCLYIYIYIFIIFPYKDRIDMPLPCSVYHARYAPMTSQRQICHKGHTGDQQSNQRPGAITPRIPWRVEKNHKDLWKNNKCRWKMLKHVEKRQKMIQQE